MAKSFRDGKYVAFTDGGARPNPGHAGHGFAIFQGSSAMDHAEEPVCTGYQYLGNNRTNNFAEYSGVLAALQTLRPLKPQHTVIATDSSLVIKQLTGFWAIRNQALKDMAKRIQMEIENHHQRVTFEHVRGHSGVPGNEYADKLATLAVTTKMSHVQWMQNLNNGADSARAIMQRLDDIERRMSRLESR